MSISSVWLVQTCYIADSDLEAIFLTEAEALDFIREWREKEPFTSHRLQAQEFPISSRDLAKSSDSGVQS